MDCEDFLSIVSLCLDSHSAQQQETLDKSPDANDVGVVLVLLPGYTIFWSLNSYTDDMWVYLKRAHMSVNGGERCVGVFAEACSSGKQDGSTG